MGNSESYISTDDSSSECGSSTSTFDMLRHMSYDSDVFYPEIKSQYPSAMTFEKPKLPDVTPENFPNWRTNDINPVLLKYMKRSYKPCPETFKASAKKLAELSAAQKIPKFVSSFGGSQCAKMHWACLAGWCMCRYQYLPMTPLHLMPHTRLTSNNLTPKNSTPSTSQDEISITSSVTSSNEGTLAGSPKTPKPFAEAMDTFDDGEENFDATRKEIMQLIGKETTV